MSAVSPCLFPGCTDVDGNPTLTTDVMCTPSRRRFWRLIMWLASDWATLTYTLPTPTTGNGIKVKTSPVPGHPAEWASDTAALIAAKFNWTDDALRDHLGLLPPPHPTVGEKYRMRHALTTFDAHFDTLCVFPGAHETAKDFLDVHAKIRAVLGHTRQRDHVPTPCPDCGLITLVREVGLDRSNTITCEACGRQIREEHHALYQRILITEILEAG